MKLNSVLASNLKVEILRSTRESQYLQICLRIARPNPVCEIREQVPVNPAGWVPEFQEVGLSPYTLRTDLETQCLNS